MSRISCFIAPVYYYESHCQFGFIFPILKVKMKILTQPSRVIVNTYLKHIIIIIIIRTGYFK